MRTTHSLSSRIAHLLCLMLCLMILFCGDLLTATESAGLETIDLVKSRAVAPVVNPQSGPEVVGQWSSVITVPIVAIHMHLLPNGKVFLFQDDNHPNYNTNGTRLAGYTVAYVWDVSSGVFTQIDNTTKNEFCSGHSLLPDGRLLIAGGHDGQDGFGTRDAFIFDSSNNTWIQTNQPMAQGRWYPSTVTLGNGEVVVVSGAITGGGNNTPEVWQTNSGGGWRLLSNATLGLFLYPYMHLAPNGKVFVSGPEATTRYLDTAGTGTWTTVGNRVGGNRDYGSSVTYDVGKVVIIGGGDPPVSSAEVIDLNQSSPAWSSVGSMAQARRQMNATLLPDGKVLVTGGSSAAGFSEPAGAVLAAEMWNPATGNFAPMASMAKARLYHSTAILLPDGRVLSAGSGRPGTEQKNAEIFSPPYLFTTGGGAAVRPTIDSHLSKGVRPGETIFVTTPEAASITSVTLAGLSSVTHSRNMNQRFNRLTFTQGLGGLNVTLPADANACPPGPYMIFILNSSGVPSVAKFINVNSSNPLPPSAPGNLVATATSTSSASLTWGAPSGSVDHYEIQRSLSRNGPFTTLAPTSATSFTDSPLSSGTTYIYRVRAVDGQGNYSGFSNIDIATTIIFADDPLVASVTVVKAQHLTQLRQAVDAVRAAAALGGASWSDSAPLGVVIKAVHITELRSNLDQARGLLGLSTGSYTDSITPGVTVVKAIHIQELRDRVK
jgi:galactose oxidase-like protein/glyoxal oxidase-like protein/fibronectin type III domain protein